MTRQDIAVVLPSYQHRRFIGDAIESILAQSLKPSKIIVVDDGSTDDSADVVKAFDDPRITLIVHAENRGGAAALNTALGMLDAEYFAILNSDDVWRPDKLEKQYHAIKDNDDVGAVFSLASAIDHTGKPIGDSMFEKLFMAKNNVRSQHLLRLFEVGNFLCHPSILARTSVYNDVGHYDNRFRQLPDYHMWLKILQKYEILILQEPLVLFRHHETNTSKPDAENTLRDRCEWRYILEEFITTLGKDNFCRAFGSLRDPADPRFSLAVEKIAYLTTIPGARSPLYRDIANRMALDLLASEAGRMEWHAYGLTHADLYTLTGVQSQPGSRNEELRLTPPQAELYFHLIGEKPRPETSRALS